jgi:energy-coupling factor transporter ATP-binding protein EcfA2
MKTAKSPYILVVVGDSAAGKTTLLGTLRRIKSLRATIRDMDQEGVPWPGREHWRQYRVEQLLADSIKDYKRGKSAVMGGWIWPAEIMSSPYFDPNLNIHLLFLKNTAREYRRRLKARVGPQLTKKQYEEWCANFPNQQRRLENQVRFVANHFIIDTWKLTRAEVVKETLHIIEEIGV